MAFAIKHIDETLLENDLRYRTQYVREFMGFSDEDIAAIHAAAPLLAPAVPGLVDAVYEKLFTYDATKRHFVPRQSGYEGDTPESLEALATSHEMITFRKHHLGRYLVSLVSRQYDDKMMSYLDMVGKMHTLKAGSAELNVPLVQMNALMGFVADAITATLLSLGLERRQEVATVRAFNKLLWLQNDLINRHYASSSAATGVAA